MRKSTARAKPTENGEEAMNISVPPVRASEPLPVQDHRRLHRHARHPRARQRGRAQARLCRTGSSATSTPITSRRVSWSEIVEYIEDPVVRDNAMRFQNDRDRRAALWPQRRSRPALSVVGGRIPHQDGQREKIDDDRRASRRGADAARDGLARHRLHGGVPDADAVARHASAARDGGRGSAAPTIAG